MVDTSYAPLFMRLELMDKIKKLNLFNDFPQVKRWSHNLLSRDSVKNSVVEDFEDLHTEFLKKQGGYIAQ